MTEREVAYVKYRQRYLPRQIADTERKLEGLRREAARYRLILDPPECEAG